jgi:selenocysteine lyase/cysteine desulfurase
VADEHRDGEPVEQNWINRAGSQDFARLVDYRDDYQPGARRYDVGQRTKFELVPMAVAALEQLTAWGVATVAERLAVVTEAIVQRIADLGLDPTPAGQRGPHLLGVTVPDDLRDTLLPALAEADCYAAVRGRALRIAPHLHVTERDVDRLVQALHEATTARR